MQKPREAEREEMATEGGVKGGGGRVELETLIIDSVGEVASAIEAAEHVDEVICALYSLAVRIFPVDSSALCDNVGQAYRSKICEVTLPTDIEMSDWRQAFYYGAAFPALARMLIYNVAKKWLACFPLSTKKQVYDSFFVKGPPTEIVQVLVPALTHGYDDAFYSNIERLLVRCLLKSEGIRRMIGEFRIQCQGGELDASGPGMLAVISRVAQMLTSIPDKTRLQASSALSSHLFFQQVAIQLLNGAEDCESVILNKRDASDPNILDGSLLFIGESFSRICRRGSTDILIIHMIPRVLDHVRGCLSSTVGSNAYRMIESSPKSQFWLYMMEAMKDQYAVERLTEALLRQLATQNISDVEAYWMLWLLFHQTFNQKITMRSMFVDKFLVWKVFPICCLRWILQFSVFECPPNSDSPASSQNRSSYLDVVDQLGSIWSRREFVQSSSMEQQAYVTAAVGLCLERMSTEELEKTKDVMKYILQGVRCRLENPNGLVRKMACSVALAFSKVVDPKKPLYLDDDCSDIIDWEFGLTSLRKDVIIDHQTRKDESKVSLPEERKNASHAKRPNDMNRNPVNGSKMILENKVHSSKIMDSAVPSNKLISAEEEEDDDEGKNSDASSDSLEPYDLSDDDSDLRKFSQLGDVVAALRKPDDPDGVEKALDVVEKLVRASPDELPHHSGDLVRVLVHLHCSDVAVEGEEDSAEEKRQKALVALLVTCPFESLDVLTRALYSPNVDVSQRILILDVMTEAAQELSESTVIRRKHQPRNLISTISGQPWFIPSSRGPPGAGPWKEVSDPGTSINWSHRYEREIPSRAGQIKSGKSRKWGLAKAKDPLLETSKNRFPLHAAAFMLPVMQGFDKRRHGVDLLGRDFIVLGKLIYMLGVCMKCVTMHPEASALAPALLDMIRSRELSHHPEAYVRRALLFAASCILVALHPSHVASALIEGNQEISNGLEWIRTWALHIAESDPDAECSTMAMTCLQLHAEMALQTSRALESAESIKARTTTHQPLKLDKIIIPFTADMR